MSKKYTAEYWASEIVRTREKHEKFFKDADESIKLYQADHDFEDVARRLNVWWYLNQTLLPAYYSRIPKVQVELKKKSGGEIYQVAARAIERFTQTGLDEFIDFRSVLYDGSLSLLLSGRSIFWVRYEAEIGQLPFTQGLMLGEDKRLVYPDGRPFDGDESEVEEDENGYSITSEIESKDGEQALIECVHYKDYLTSCGRNKDEIEWKSRRAYLSKHEAVEKFGKELAEDLSYNVYPEDVTDGRFKEKDTYEGKAELEEIWCEESGKVYWVHRNGEKSILEEGPPPLKFKDFYPCSELSSCVSPNSVIPVSDYVHCRDQILEVEQLTTRLFGCLRAVRANFAYDATVGASLEALLKGDLKGIPVSNWPNYKQRGGMSSMMEFLPIDGYIKALEVINNARNQALERLYETTKASDILRGQSDPNETATAVQLRSDWGSLGLKVRQQMFAEHVSCAISKFSEIMCEQFSAERLYELADAEDLLQGAPPEVWMQLDQVFKSDAKRRYHITIASDSLMALDERIERQERADLLSSAGSFLGQMAPFIEKYPPMAPAAMELIQYVARSYKGGKEIEAPLKQALGAISQMAQQQQQAMANQPQPGAQEAQARMQIAQIDAQIKNQQMQFTAQESQQRGYMEMQKFALEGERLKLEHSQHVIEAQLRMQELQLKAQEIAATIGQKQQDGAVDAKVAMFQTAVDAQKMEIEKYRIQLETYEKLLEEKRLSLDSQMKSAEIRSTKEPKGEMPPLNISIDMTKGKRKRGTLRKNPMSGETEVIMEELDDGPAPI